MTSLLTVPGEIQLRITYFLNDQRDRISLARCCSRLLAIIQSAGLPQLKVSTPCSWKLEQILQLLLRHPTLARSVQRLELGQPSCDSHHHSALAPVDPDETVRETVKKLSQDAHEASCWINDLQDPGCPDAWMALVLYLLPNLASLEWFWGGRGTKYTGTLLARVSLHEPPFDKILALQSLAEVCFKATKRTWTSDPKTRDPGFRITKMAPFFGLPTMRKLTGQMVYGRAITLAPPSSSSITHLELRQSNTDAGFPELIAPCTNLKSFKYYHMDGKTFSHRPYIRHFSDHRPSAFMAPLAEKANTLETLCLSYHPFLPIPSCSSLTFIGPFTKFYVLKHLQLPMANLTELGDRTLRTGSEPMPLIDQLPPSLERLSVTEWAFEDWDREEKELLDDMIQLATSRERFQYLSKIEIHARILSKDNAAALCRLVKACKSDYPARDALLNAKLYTDTRNLASTCRRMGIVLTIHDSYTDGYLHGFEDFFSN